MVNLSVSMDCIESEETIYPRRRSVSSSGIRNQPSDHLGIKSTKSCIQDYSTNYDVRMDMETNSTEEKGYETRQIPSNQVFIVKDDMLNYHGKRYTLHDIAPRWKKDCRMWLWKQKSKKKIQRFGEIDKMPMY